MERPHRMKKADVSYLLDETPEAYYWMGFLMADGSFTANRLSLTLSMQDEGHVRKFANFIRYSGKSKPRNNTRKHSSKIACMDTYYVKKIMDKFGISKNKTYHPPKHLIVADWEKQLALIVGFIDGDGCIDHQSKREDCKIRVKLHSSWLNILNEMLCVIHDRCGRRGTPAKINNQGYAQFTITNSIIVKWLKRTIVSLNLPVMSRKWKKIDMNLIGRIERCENRTSLVLLLAKQGFRIKEICQKTELGYMCVYQILRRNNMEVIPGKRI